MYLITDNISKAKVAILHLALYWHWMTMILYYWRHTLVTAKTNFTLENDITQLLPCVNKIKNQGLIKEIVVKEYKKLSYETSIDKIKAKYLINTEQIHKHDKQLYECKCGSNILRLSDKARHFKTIKHTTWHNIQNLPN